MANTQNNRGLGRGFDSLIPQNFDNSLLLEEQDRIQKLLIEDIKPNATQPRENFDQQALEELASSIKRHGVLQPVVVRVIEDGGYSIVAGERRWRAAQMVGHSHIPAIVRTLEELEQLEIALVENVQRVDLSPLEQAVSIERLHENFSMSYDEIAKRLGKGLATVVNSVRLLNLPPEAQQALRDKLITEGHARAILALKNMPDKQADLLKFIIKNKWSVRQAEQFAVACKKSPTSSKEAHKKTETSTPATKKLSKKLGREVTIRRKAKGGKLEIAFGSDKELSQLIDELAEKF